MNGRALILFATALLGACSREPAAYPPPEQRPLIAENRPYRLNRVMNMDDPDASSRFVRDIGQYVFGNWRWAQQRPAVRVFVRDNVDIKYLIDFALPEVTFKDTGPVTLTFYVNDHKVDSVRYTEAGSKHFAKVLPPEWVPVGRESTVAAEIDKLWVSPQDGSKFGFILVRMGLTQRDAAQEDVTQQ